MLYFRIVPFEPFRELLLYVLLDQFEGVTIHGTAIPVDELLTHLIEEGTSILLVLHIETSCKDFEYVLEDISLTLKTDCSINWIERVLLKVYRIKEIGFKIDGIVIKTSTLLTYYLHHLVHFVTSEEDPACIASLVEIHWA